MSETDWLQEIIIPNCTKEVFTPTVNKDLVVNKHVVELITLLYLPLYPPPFSFLSLQINYSHHAWD